MKEAIEATILANGDFPVARQPLCVLAEAPFVVCCDGGANEYIRRGHVPDAIVGDGDSLSPLYRERYAHLMHHVREQETNDQTKAVLFLLAKGMRRIAIVGATGKREDHTLGNISLLVEYMRLGAEVRMYTDYGVFVPCRDACSFSCRKGQQVSVFNFTANGMQAEGLAYPLRDFTNWWQGTLNECTGAQFSIRATGDYLVFLNY